MTSSSAPGGENRLALMAALSCYLIWGFVPLVFQAVNRLGVGPWEILAHRIVWSIPVAFLFVFLAKQGGHLREVLRNRRTLAWLFLSSLLIATNWVVFIWAVTSNRMLESSLGYYINPLVNVLLGVVVLGERLRRQQWLAVGFAAAGVSYLTWQAGALPWIALMLALSFGGYGLLRKTVGVDAMAGLGTETLLTSPIAIAYLVYCELQGDGAFLKGDIGMLLMLALSGLLTALPLWLFSYGARRVPYSTVGLLQYIGPTISLALGVLVLHEPFGATRAVGFVFIWIGCLIYAIDSFRAR